MTVKEELTKLLMESYDRGLADASQAAVVAIEKAMLLEREACAKLCDGWDFVPGGHEFTPQQLTKNLTETIANHIRARGNT